MVVHGAQALLALQVVAAEEHGTPVRLQVVGITQVLTRQEGLLRSGVLVGQLDGAVLLNKAVVGMSSLYILSVDYKHDDFDIGSNREALVRSLHVTARPSESRATMNMRLS